VNHFAHLVLAQPTAESTVGNLLGDFARGVALHPLSPEIRDGLANHRLVDRLTDRDPRVARMKASFSPQRRRFAGIALDIYFDHLLITHWHELEAGSADDAIQSCYQRIDQAQPLMPSARMQQVMASVVEHDWFGSYRDIDSLAHALDRVAGRIRFANRFAGAIEDLLNARQQILDGFMLFFPDLRREVEFAALES